MSEHLRTEGKCEQLADTEAEGPESMRQLARTSEPPPGHAWATCHRAVMADGTHLSHSPVARREAEGDTGPRPGARQWTIK